MLDFGRASVDRPRTVEMTPSNRGWLDGIGGIDGLYRIWGPAITDPQPREADDSVNSGPRTLWRTRYAVDLIGTGWG